MFNHNSMKKVHPIKKSHTSGWFIRRMAKSIDRKTVKSWTMTASLKRLRRSKLNVGANR